LEERGAKIELGAKAGERIAVIPIDGSLECIRVVYRIYKAHVSIGAVEIVPASRKFAGKEAEQGARANDHGCHAACDQMSFEMKLRNPDPNEARGAPATVVAHL